MADLPVRFGSRVSFDGPHGRPRQHERCQDQSDENAQFGDGRPVSLERRQRPRVPSPGDRHTGLMRRVGEVDALLAIRRDRDGANGRIEALAFEPAEHRFHVRHRRQFEIASQLFGDPAPEVDADAHDRAVDVHVSVGRHVIDRDPQRWRSRRLVAQGLVRRGRDPRPGRRERRAGSAGWASCYEKTVRPRQGLTGSRKGWPTRAGS